MSPVPDSLAPLFTAAAARHGVPEALLLAIASVESGFKATAIRQEPHINDASRGLMQILYRTAQGVGYQGTPAGLFDPAANLDAGAAYLRGLLDRHAGDMWAAVSAYNNGHGRRATKVTTVCLARSQTTGECVQSFTAQPGEFLNQPYVEKVRRALDGFGGMPGGVWPVLALGALWWLVRRRGG